MVEVIWTEPALEDLNALAEYIALDKPEAASELVRRVFAHVELLVGQPELGPRIPELRPNRRCRQIVEPPCRVFYRYEPKSRRVYILGVMRGEKLFQRRLILGATLVPSPRSGTKHTKETKRRIAAKMRKHTQNEGTGPGFDCRIAAKRRKDTQKKGTNSGPNVPEGLMM